MKQIIILLTSLILLLSGLASAQEEAEALTQFRRTIFRLQQEILQLKEAQDLQERELRSQREDLALQVEQLNRENQKLKQHLLEMDSLLLQMEDKLESSSVNRLSKQLDNLRNFNKAILLDEIGQIDQSEALLLAIVNQPETVLPKDLLILILAQQKKNQGLFEESISYYSTLLVEFFDSPYFSRAIYEMSEVLGRLEKNEQQVTLLTQLAALSKTDPYSIKASKKLDEMGVSLLVEDESPATDASGDVEQPETIAVSPAKTSSDSSTDGLPVGPTTDVTPDSMPLIINVQEDDPKPADASGDVEQPETIAVSSAKTSPDSSTDGLPVGPTTDVTPDSMPLIINVQEDDPKPADASADSNDPMEIRDDGEARLVDSSADVTSNQTTAPLPDGDDPLQPPQDTEEAPDALPPSE